MCLYALLLLLLFIRPYYVGILFSLYYFICSLCRPGCVIFFRVYSWLVKVLGQFFQLSITRGLGLRLGFGLGLVWCYCQGKFRVSVIIRVRVGFGLML